MAKKVAKGHHAHTSSSHGRTLLAVATKNRFLFKEISSPASRQHAQTGPSEATQRQTQYCYTEVPSQEKLFIMPSAAALRAHQEKDAEFAPSNPFDGADEGLLLGTASDVVAEVAAKTNLFDAARDDIFPVLTMEVRLECLLTVGCGVKSEKFA